MKTYEYELIQSKIIPNDFIWNKTDLKFDYMKWNSYKVKLYEMTLTQTELYEMKLI